MTTAEVIQPIDIAAAFGDEAADHVSARLLPFAGPTFSDMEESRRRWLAGERVTPVALHVGEIILSGTFLDRLTLIPRLYGVYSTLHALSSARPVRGDFAIGNTFGTRLFHDLVGIVAVSDANRRGVTNPITDLDYTYGGIQRFKGFSSYEHVDDAEREECKLRYGSTALGDTTRLRLRQLSRKDVDDEAAVYPNQLEYPYLPDMGSGLIAVTMFELHTPHNTPAPSNRQRLYTTLDVVNATDTNPVLL